MKSSKIPRKYQLSINFLDKKKTVFPISEKFKTKTFPFSKNMVFHAEENIILHRLFESKEDRIYHLWKVQNRNFPTIWTFPFVQNSCFCNNFSFSFIATYVSFNHFKDLLNLHYKRKYEAKLRNFFSLNFQWWQHNIWQFWWHQRSLETEFCSSTLKKPKQKRQYFNWNSINLDQIHHIRNKLGAISFSWRWSHKTIAYPP